MYRSFKSFRVFVNVLETRKVEAKLQWSLKTSTPRRMWYIFLQTDFALVNFAHMMAVLSYESISQQQN